MGRLMLNTQISLSVVFEECLHLFHASRLSEFVDVADALEGRLEASDGIED